MFLFHFGWDMICICMFPSRKGPVVPKLLCSVVSLKRKRRQDPPLLAPLPVTRTRPLEPPSLVEPCSKTRSPGTAHSARRLERPGSSREVSMGGGGGFLGCRFGFSDLFG